MFFLMISIENTHGTEDIFNDILISYKYPSSFLISIIRVGINISKNTLSMSLLNYRLSPAYWVTIPIKLVLNVQA